SLRLGRGQPLCPTRAELESRPGSPTVRRKSAAVARAVDRQDLRSPAGPVRQKGRSLLRHHRVGLFATPLETPGLFCRPSATARAGGDQQAAVEAGAPATPPCRTVSLSFGTRQRQAPHRSPTGLFCACCPVPRRLPTVASPQLPTPLLSRCLYSRGLLANQATDARAVPGGQKTCKTWVALLRAGRGETIERALIPYSTDRFPSLERPLGPPLLRFSRAFCQ